MSEPELARFQKLLSQVNHSIQESAKPARKRPSSSAPQAALVQDRQRAIRKLARELKSSARAMQEKSSPKPSIAKRDGRSGRPSRNRDAGLAVALAAKRNPLDANILRLVAESPKRYTELAHELGVRHENNLTVALQRLGRDGLIEQATDIEEGKIVRSYEATVLGKATLVDADRVMSAVTGKDEAGANEASDLRFHLGRGEVPIRVQTLLDLVQLAARSADG